MKAALREMYFPIRNIQENLQILQEVRGKDGDLESTSILLSQGWEDRWWVSSSQTTKEMSNFKMKFS